MIGILQAAKRAGVEIDQLPAVALPYGTGNDLARVTKWGGAPSGKDFKDLTSIVKTICEGSTVRDFNVWNIHVKFRDGGGLIEFNSKSKKLK
jgi:hypothetical protein